MRHCPRLAGIMIGIARRRSAQSCRSPEQHAASRHSPELPLQVPRDDAPHCPRADPQGGIRHSLQKHESPWVSKGASLWKTGCDKN